MPSRRPRFAVLSLLLLLLCVQGSGWGQNAARAGRRQFQLQQQAAAQPQKPAPAPVPAPETQPQSTPAPEKPAETGPVLLPPATLEQMPARPPDITLNGGDLTIVAQNSTLADILEAVSTKTGAKIDVPEGADERVVAKLGPGPVRDVLDSLLMGCKFNYVMLGSETDSAALTEVVLFAKLSDTDKNADPKKAAQSFTPANRTTMQERRVQTVMQSAAHSESPDTPEETEPAAVAAAPPVATASAPEPASAAASVNESSAQETAKTDSPPAPSADDHPRTPNIRTMQETLQNLYSQRRQQMEQQQQQQQQPSGPPQQ